jgi:hypothetical protein
MGWVMRDNVNSSRSPAFVKELLDLGATARESGKWVEEP